MVMMSKPVRLACGIKSYFGENVFGSTFSFGPVDRFNFISLIVLLKETFVGTNV